MIQGQVARNIVDVKSSGRKISRTGQIFFTKRIPNNEHNGYMNLFIVEIK